MKRGLFLFVPLGLLSACGSPWERHRDGADSVQVVLEEVQVRQYADGQRVFFFEAPRVVLDEDGAVVRAPRGVRGRIEDVAWEDREP